MAVAQADARPNLTLAEARERVASENGMALDEMLKRLRGKVGQMLEGVGDLGVDFRGTVSATVGFRWDPKTERYQFAFRVSEPVYKSAPADPAVDLDIPFETVSEAQLKLAL